MEQDKHDGTGHPCRGCFHWRGSYYGDICCNYIFDMNRHRPCPPGAECTERVVGIKAYKKKLKSQSHAPELSPQKR